MNRQPRQSLYLDVLRKITALESVVTKQRDWIEALEMRLKALEGRSAYLPWCPMPSAPVIPANPPWPVLQPPYLTC